MVTAVVLWSLCRTVVILWSLWCHCGHCRATVGLLWSLSLREYCGGAKVATVVTVVVLWSLWWHCGGTVVIVVPLWWHCGATVVQL